MELSSATLSDDFISQLVTELVSSSVIGMTFGGSYARGEATHFSDVDLGCFFAEQVQLPQVRFFYRNDLLISVKSMHVSDVYSRLARPRSVLFLGGSKRRILLDKDGSLSKLQQDVEAFTWERLHEAANDYVSLSMMLLAEQVQKVLSELYRHDMLALAYATERLIAGLTEAIAVHRRLLITSERTYYQQVQENAGLDSSWVRLHLMAVEVTTEVSDISPVEVRAQAALQLYRETLLLVRAVLSPDHLAVAERVVRMW